MKRTLQGIPETFPGSAGQSDQPPRFGQSMVPGSIGEATIAFGELGLLLRNAMDQLGPHHRPIFACALPGLLQGGKPPIYSERGSGGRISSCRSSGHTTGRVRSLCQ